MAFFGKAVLEEEPDERGKVFTWTREKRIWMHLSAFLLFSILIHGSGFYLFKVVYPSPVRVETEPDAVTVLEPTDPAVRSLLQRLSDRTIFLLPPSAQSAARLRREEERVRFTPAFQRAELQLVVPPSLAKGPGLPDPLPPSLAVRPGGEVGDLAGAVRIKLDPALADRGYAPWSILHDYLSLADSLLHVRLMIAITPGGEVRVTGVEAALEESEKRELSAVIESTLRFVPAPDSATGWIEVGGG